MAHPVLWSATVQMGPVRMPFSTLTATAFNRTTSRRVRTALHPIRFVEIITNGKRIGKYSFCFYFWHLSFFFFFFFSFIHKLCLKFFVFWMNELPRWWLLIVHFSLFISSLSSLDITSNWSHTIQITSRPAQETWYTWNHRPDFVRKMHDWASKGPADDSATTHRSVLMDVIWCVAAAVIAPRKWLSSNVARVRSIGVAKSNVNHAERKKRFIRAYKIARRWNQIALLSLS